MLSTINSLSRSPSRELQYYMENDGHVSPSDPIGKLFTVWYREDLSEKILKLIMKELLGGVVQQNFGKQTEEKNAEYLKKMSSLFDL